MDWNVLKDLVYCHSTPGNEDEVADYLSSAWRSAGCKTEGFGRFALLAKSPDWVDGRPTMLVCAHADAPGFIVQSVHGNGKYANVVTLGYPHVSTIFSPTPVVIKTSDGYVDGTLTVVNSARGMYECAAKSEISQGDRICFKPEFAIEEGRIAAPFLDNRVGCFITHQLVNEMISSRLDVNLMVAVTASEEFLGFGAAVLAHNVKPDIVIALDTTYEDSAQNVLCGNGPVLTLSDKSVIVGMKQWNALRKLCGTWGLPVQSEVYNFSGTDARAFPQAGCFAPVFPLLVATEGNHTICEKCLAKDIEVLFNIISCIASDTANIEALKCSFN